MATYNRPAVLAFAIRSVLAQDFADWELIVVGDRCSEATGVLVGSFADRRIRYINLALNTGEQSGPNNVGIARARGRTSHSSITTTAGLATISVRQWTGCKHPARMP